MMTFTSSADLSRLQETDPAHTVISTMLDGGLLDAPSQIALMEPHDHGSHISELWQHGEPDSAVLEGILLEQELFLAVIHAGDGRDLVIVIPDAEWLPMDVRESIENNINH